MPDITASELAALRDRAEKAEAAIYHTRPGEMEFGGEGWTWKQQARATEDRLRESEARADRAEADCRVLAAELDSIVNNPEYLCEPVQRALKRWTTLPPVDRVPSNDGLAL